MSQPIPPFTDWPKAALVKEVVRARKSEQRYKDGLDRIARWPLPLFHLDAAAMRRIARKALGRKP